MTDEAYGILHLLRLFRANIENGNHDLARSFFTSGIESKVAQIWATETWWPDRSVPIEDVAPLLAEVTLWINWIRSLPEYKDRVPTVRAAWILEAEEIAVAQRVRDIQNTLVRAFEITTGDVSIRRTPSEGRVDRGHALSAGGSVAHADASVGDEDGAPGGPVARE